MVEKLNIQNAKRVFVFPKNKKTIAEYELENYSDYYDTIRFLRYTMEIAPNAFKNCNFKYRYVDIKNVEIVFSKTLPEDRKQVDYVVDIDIMKKAFCNFDYTPFFSTESKLISGSEAYEIAIILNKLNFQMPFQIAQEIFVYEDLPKFLKNGYFKNFRKQFPNLENNELLQDPDNMCAFYNLASFLGCFSKEKIKDKNGLPTDELVCQKACVFLDNLLKSGALEKWHLENVFSNNHINFCTNPKQDFLKFISAQDNHKKFVNFELLSNLEKEKYGLFMSIFYDFEKILPLRKVIGENGKIKQLSWEKAIKKYLYVEKYNYKYVDETNIDIAKEFSYRGIDNSTFLDAIRIRSLVENENMPHHILGKPLGEMNMKEFVEKIENSNELSQEQKEKAIKRAKNRKFTYEMLDKYDPKNATIGLYTDCCATLDSQYYGKDIVVATMTNPNVQNIVVKNYDGKIIAKGTLYISRSKGYGVINDFELDLMYKKHEMKENSGGFYDVQINSEDEKDRDKIFMAFKRGVNKFANEYNKINKVPLRKITVGIGHNRLKRQCYKLKGNFNLEVPKTLSFYDAADDHQRLLY